jgi:hypothetical protein
VRKLCRRNKGEITLYKEQWCENPEEVKMMRDPLIRKNGERYPVEGRMVINTL